MLFISDMKHVFRLFPLSILLFSSINLWSTHIVGGEMTYRCLGNNQYEVTLTVYRDCFNGVPWFDNPAFVAIYNASWQKVGPTLNFSLVSTSNDTLPIELQNPCLVAPPNVCVHRTIYKRTVTLPFSPGGYTLVYQRCCRNLLIRNTPDPLNTGISIIAEIGDQALLACNGGATFNSWPPVAICVNEPIDFDHSASDPDGDSLAYRLCTPLNGPDSLDPRPLTPYPGPYQEIIWTNPPYSLNNVLGGIPLTINPNTGFMTGVPNTLGNFVVGVCVDEFRNGAVISTTRRDFQYNVADCGRPRAAFSAPELQCNDLLVRFKNSSSNAKRYKWFYDWPDTFNTSGVASPVYFYPDTGTYTVALIVEPDGICSDTFFQTIRLANSYVDAKASISNGDCDDDGLEIRVQDLSTDTVFGLAGWQWLLFQGNTLIEQSAAQTPVFVVEAPGAYRLQLIAESANGCRDSLSLFFNPPIPPIGALADTLYLCAGDSARLFPGANPAFNYNWAPTTGLSDPDAPNPTVFGDTSRRYSVLIDGNGPCIRTGSVWVQVVSASDPVAVSATPSLIVAGTSSQLSAFFPGAIGYQWSPSVGLSQTDIPNPVAAPDQTTTYYVKAVLPGGDCGALGTVTVRVRENACVEPYVFFPNAFSPNGDGENDVLKLEGLFVEEVYWVVYNRWGEKVFEAFHLDDAWDGTYKGVPQPAEAYGYYLRVRCLGTSFSERKGNVTLLR